MSILKLSNVRKRFGDNEVLCGIDLEVPAGQVVCLIGASGSGKSTLLRCIDLLEQVDDGTIHFEGRDVTDPRVNPDEVRRRIGMVFQAYNLFPHLSVIDNVALGRRRIRGENKEQANAHALKLLERVDLSGKADARPDSLSGGQQQRVALVRAMALEPPMLLLDEVTSALDPMLVGEVLDVVKDLAAGGTTVLMATHEMAFAREVSDRVLFLADGRIEEDGSPSQVFGEPRNPRTAEFLARFLR